MHFLYCDTFLAWSLSNQLKFSVVVHYKIHNFDGEFFLATIRISMVTKLVRVVTYHEELLPINLHDPSMTWFCEVTVRVKWNIYLHLQKTHGHHGHLTILSRDQQRSRDNLINQYLFFSQDTWPVTLVECWLQGEGGGSASKGLSWHRPLVYTDTGINLKMTLTWWLKVLNLHFFHKRKLIRSTRLKLVRKANSEYFEAGKLKKTKDSI